jgi:5'-nucleotidase (lipoprotein e(P4) family)
MRQGVFVLIGLMGVFSLSADARRGAVPEVGLDVRWSQSAEHDAVIAGIYASALDEILHTATRLPADARWVVVSDVDETLIDNSAYQVETGSNYTPETWAEWEARGEAVPLEGALGFVGAIHAAGGQMAYVTNRKNHDATLALLKQHGMWGEDDRLCVRVEESDKSNRRASIREGTAGCGWEGQPMRVLAYLGDQRGDFPAEEEEPSDGTRRWGASWFMVPNPMYGDWARDVE